MAETNPPLWLQTRDHPAEGVRRWAEAITWGATGVFGDSDLQCSAGGGMVIDVAPGRALVPGTLNAQQGTYFVDAPTVTEVTLDGGNADPRIDLIVAVVNDSIYAGSEPEDGWKLDKVTGTPAPSPTAPAAPANSIVLAQVVVAASATAAGSINDLRRLAERPGEQVYSTTAERDSRVSSPRPGQQVYVSGEQRHYFWTGSAWAVLFPKVTISSSSPSGGVDGDLWVKVS